MIIEAIYIHNEMTTPKGFHGMTTPTETLDVFINSHLEIAISHANVATPPITRCRYLQQTLLQSYSLLYFIVFFSGHRKI